MSNNKTSGGIGFTGLLLLAFIILKLCNVIDWSWWWVMAPLWIPFALLAVVYMLMGILGDNDKRKPVINNKSRWQERMEEMQKAKNKNNES